MIETEELIEAFTDLKTPMDFFARVLEEFIFEAHNKLREELVEEVKVGYLNMTPHPGSADFFQEVPYPGMEGSMAMELNGRHDYDHCVRVWSYLVALVKHPLLYEEHLSIVDEMRNLYNGLDDPDRTTMEDLRHWIKRIDDYSKESQILNRDADKLREDKLREDKLLEDKLLDEIEKCYFDILPFPGSNEHFDELPHPDMKGYLSEPDFTDDEYAEWAGDWVHWVKLAKDPIVYGEYWEIIEFIQSEIDYQTLEGLRRWVERIDNYNKVFSGTHHYGDSILDIKKNYTINCVQETTCYICLEGVQSGHSVCGDARHLIHQDCDRNLKKCGLCKKTT